LLAYAKPLKHIYLTGKKPGVVPQLDAESAKSIINDGRGWNNKDRNSAYDKLTQDELFERLASWSPIVRDRAAMALSRKGNVPLDALLKMLAAPELEARYGACAALGQMKAAAVPAIPALRDCLKDDDLWLRIEAAEALASIGEPAMVVLPELLTMLTKVPSKEDPRGMEQRYLSFVVFGDMLKRSPLDGVDRDLLRAAIAAGLKNQDGRSRGSIGGIYQKLSYEEIKPLLPAIHEAIVTPAPSGIMFASGIRLAGLELFAKHKIREGLPLCIDVMEIQNWGKQARIEKCLDALAMYGSAAKSELQRLRQLEKDLTKHGEARNLERFVVRIRSMIEELEKTPADVELRSLR